MEYSNLGATLSETLNHLVRRIAEYVPNLLGALLLLLVGWLLARVGRAIAARLSGKVLGGLARSRNVAQSLERTGLRQRIPQVVGGLTYWVILLLFAAAAIERLELTVATTLLSGLANYLPRVLLGILLVLFGLLAGNVTNSLVSAAAASAGLQYPSLLGRTSQIFVVFISLVLGAEQVGIHTTLLTVIATLVLGSGLGGIALAFGLGSGAAVGNIVSSYYLVRTYRAGQTVRIGGHQGRILEITQTGVVLDTPEGRTFVPARKFSEEASLLLAGEA